MSTDIISKKYNKNKFATLYDNVVKIWERGLPYVFGITNIICGNIIIYQYNNKHILMSIWLIINGYKEIIDKKYGNIYYKTTKEIIWDLLGLIVIYNKL